MRRIALLVSLLVLTLIAVTFVAFAQQSNLPNEVDGIEAKRRVEIETLVREIADLDKQIKSKSIALTKLKSAGVPEPVLAEKKNTPRGFVIFMRCGGLMIPDAATEGNDFRMGDEIVFVHGRTIVGKGLIEKIKKW